MVHVYVAQLLKVMLNKEIIVPLSKLRKQQRC